MLINPLKTPFIRLITTIVAIIPMMAYSASDRETAIEQRIQPVGQVNTSDQVAPVAGAAAGPAMSPEDRYKAVCHICHDTGVSGAPKFGDKAAWKARVSAGMDTVYDRAIKGYNAMPPKGTCMTCSDDDIKKVVDYMVNAAK